jgi:hypothetical protein
MDRMMHPILVAALVTVLAHHINNPTDQPVEMLTWVEFIIDLGVMSETRSDNTDLTQYRDLCASLLARFEVGSRVQ